MTVSNAQVRKLMAELDKHGEIGKAALRSGIGIAGWVAGKAAGVSVVETGGVGGPVGIIHINDENINLAMVAGGHAWWYAKQARYELTFKQAERQARASKIGLWANPAAVAPWEWRRQ